MARQPGQSTLALAARPPVTPGVPGTIPAAALPRPSEQAGLWAYLLVCVQMRTLVWGCRMTSSEAIASV